MTEIMKLDAGQKHLMQLIVQDADSDGWAPVSKPVFPLLEKMPQALIELVPVGDEGRGRVRLTAEGRNVLNARKWL